MKEVSFGCLPQDTLTTLETLEEAFLTDDLVTTTMVDSVLEQAITDCGGQLQPDQPVIVGLGDPNELWYRANPAPEGMSAWDRSNRLPPATELKEIDAAFSGIRHHVAEGLRTAFPDKSFIVAGGRDRRIAFADGGVIKLPIDYDPNAMGFGEALGAKRQRMEALRTLYSLPEQSNFIAYNIISIDPTEKAYKGMQVQKRLAMVTLDTLLDGANPPRMETVVRYLEEIALGLDFLVQNGLRLTDISLKNIGIDSRTDRALLFDFDGLRPQDSIMEAYTAAEKWWPPERRPKSAAETDGINPFICGPLDDALKPRGPIEINEMVFELGVSLSLALESYTDIPAELAILAARMVDINPDSRPALLDVIATLRSILQEPLQQSAEFGLHGIRA